MEVYIEDIIFDNLMVDAIILLLTAKILKINYKNFLILFSALIGVFFTILNLYFELPPIFLLFYKIFLSILMVVMAFGYKNFKQFLINYFTFLFVTFLIGGACLFIAFTFGKVAIINGAMSYELTLPVGVIVGIISVVSYLLLQAVAYIKQNTIQKNYYYKIEISNANKIFKVDAFLDTGNILTDNGEPVSIINYKLFEKVFKIPFQNILLHKFDNLENAHFISIGGIGKKSKMLVFDMKNIKIIKNNYNKSINNIKFGLTFSNFEKKLNCPIILNSQILEELL